MSFNVFGHFFLDLLPSEVTFEDSPVRAEKDDMRNTLDAVKLRRDLLRVDDLVPLDTIHLGGILGCLRLVPYCDAEHFEAFLVILVIDIPDIRDLSLARTAP